MSEETLLQERHRKRLRGRALRALPDAIRYEEQVLEEALDPKAASPEHRSLRRRGVFHPPRAGAPPEP